MKTPYSAFPQRSPATRIRHFFAAAVIFCLALFSIQHGFSQGPLTPPGAPAPTMKTLAQVEPRTPIDDTNTPGDANYHHIIGQPGSYYLTANLGVTKANGILVRASGVTVDLNGFEVRRINGSGVGTGIEISNPSLPILYRCTVKNGSVSGFISGVFAQPAEAGAFLQLSVSGCSSVGLYGGLAWQIDGCEAQGNSGSGIATGRGSTVANCTASHNQGNGAILAAAGSTLLNCAAFENQSTYAILAQDGSALTNCTAFNNRSTYAISADSATLTNCTARGNTSAEPSSFGIIASAGSTVVHCTATGNTNTSGTATSQTGVGISVGADSTVKNSTAASNKGNGIQVGPGCLVAAYTANNNSSLGSGGSGIRGADGTTISDCVAIGNAEGISVGNRCKVSGCVVNSNTVNGIYAGNNARITENHTTANGGGAGTAGIHIFGNGGTIEGNTSSNNLFDGILFDTGTKDNFVFKNVARNNGGFNYRVPNLVSNSGLTGAGNNEVAPIGVPMSATSPWANLQ